MTVRAFGAAGGSDLGIKLLGQSSSYADPDGFICTGQTLHTGIPASALPLVLTQLDCYFLNDSPGTGFFRELSHSGTAILYRDGTARLICPPG